MTTLPLSLQVTSTLALPEHAWGRFSVPLPPGAGGRNAGLNLRRSDGVPVPVQTWPLASWPDGSLRILHAVAPLPGGTYSLEITNAPSTAPEGGICVHVEEDRSVVVRKGSEEICFPPLAILAAVTSSGKHVLSDDGLNFQTEWSAGGSSRLEVEGAASVRHSGPLYAVIQRWVRCVSASGYLRFRLQFEFFAGTPGMVINIMLVNDCPGADFQEIRSIEVALHQDDARHAVFQPHYGEEYLASRFVHPFAPLDIRVEPGRFHPRVANFEALDDATVYPHYLHPPPDRIGNAVFLQNDHCVLQIEMEDFHLLRPKGIRLERGRAVFSLWPEWAEPLRLQQGRRRQIRLAVHWGAIFPENLRQVQQATAALLDVHRCQLPAETYAAADFFDLPRVLSYQPDKYPRFEGWLRAMSVLHTAADFFDLGDTPDRHYQTTYMPLGYSAKKSPGPSPRLYTDSGRRAQCFEHLENHEAIWVNNEYDVLFALGTEYLRCSNLLLYRQLRWFARHTVEVDFLCHSDHPVTHRAQPAHGENHTSMGAYPSHFWTQGLIQYYFLSGDEDALEVACALADKTIWYFEHPRLGALHSGVNREIGWAVLTLISAYEATGREEYDQQARKLIDAAVAEPLPDDLPVLGFGHTSLLLGVRAYLQVHGHAESEGLWNWYRKVVDLAIRSSKTPPQTVGKQTLKLSYDFELAERGEASRLKPRPAVLSGFAAPDCLAYAYEKTGDRSYLEAGGRALLAFLDGNPGYYEKTLSIRTPVPSGKPFAMAYRTWITYLAALDRADLLRLFDYQDPFAAPS